MPGRVIRSNRYAVFQRNQLSALAILTRCEVKVLKELRLLRALGWQDEGIDAHFKSQRQRSDAAPIEAQNFWFEGMIGILRELDAAAAFIPTSGPFEFLDIGCAPGGFSTHLLRTNPHARGLGISLPESQGGHPLLLPPEYAPRYEYVEQDLLEYDLSSDSESTPPSNLTHTLPDAFLGRFQLVLLDVNALRTYHPSENATEQPLAYQAPGSILLITQLIIALATVEAGGTLVLRLSHLECSPAAQILYMLDTISDTLVVHKPRTMHMSRASFYTVAKGVGAGDRAALKDRYLADLRELWLELRAGGGRWLIENDFDFVVTAEEILDGGGYLDRLVELGRSVWAAQVQGLRSLLHNRGTHEFAALAELSSSRAAVA